VCKCAKNYENWLAVDKVIAKIIRLTFLAHPVYLLEMCLCLAVVQLMLNEFGAFKPKIHYTRFPVTSP